MIRRAVIVVAAVAGALWNFFKDIGRACFYPPNMGLHHWRIDLRYRQSEHGPVIEAITMTVSLTERRAIGDFRRLKCVAAPYLISRIPPVCLCNGVVEVEPKCYLGKW